MYVIKSEEALEKLRTITPATFKAPVVMLVCTDEASAWVNPFDDFNSHVMDSSIICTHMMMEAEDLGLGTTWVCWFDTAKVKEVFGYEPIVVNGNTEYELETGEVLSREEVLREA